MINKNMSHRSYVSQTTRYAWVAAATLITALILGTFAGIPRVEADSNSIQRGIDADAARYQAMGEFYLAKVDDDLLAANPELMVARRWQAQSFSSLGSCSPAVEATLAANPELMLVHRARSC